jgi:hypothetical protein
VTKVKPVSMGQLSKNRANEILDFVNHFDLKQFAILDDLDLMQFLDKGDAKERFVRTKDNQGLKEVGVKEKVINILNR